MPRLVTFLAPIATLACISAAVAQSLCGPGNLCGSAAPCCSEFGFCGVGTQCLGGCNPLHSHSLTSCTPKPICEDETITFTNLDRVLSNNTLYDGNATLHDFVVDSGTAFVSPSNELVLTLSQTNNGTRISSTRYVHYGRITATIKTARSAGVVNAFITMSDVKDEIDWEWPGAQTTQAQSNYFFLGQIPTGHNNGGTHDGLTDTFSNYHDYTINWTPDTLTWEIDGDVVRTLNRADTLSNDGTYYAYPSTPSRVQMSIWPAGIPSSPQGTIDWAGGLISWTDPDYVAQGHFSTLIKKVTIQCAKETATSVVNNGSLPADSQSYIYTSNATNGVVPRVFISNQSTNVNAATDLKSIVMGSGMLGGVALAVVLGFVGLLL